MAIAVTLLVASSLGPHVTRGAGARTIATGGVTAHPVIVTGRVGTRKTAALATIALITRTQTGCDRTGSVVRAGRSCTSFTFNVAVGTRPTRITGAGPVTSSTGIACTVYTGAYLVTERPIGKGIGTLGTLPCSIQLHITELTAVGICTDACPR